MKKLWIGASLVFTLALNTAYAEGDKPAQQTKMATCNKEAEGKKGDERKTFMKERLSAKTPGTETDHTKAKGTGSQQNKMKRCNEEATGLKGDERKQKMSTCLKA